MLVAVFLLSTAPAAFASQNAPLVGQDSPDAIPGKYIVVLKDRPADALSAAREVRALGGDVSHRYTNTVSGFSAELSAAAVQTLRRNPSVAWIESDQRIQLTQTQTNPTWGLDRIDQRNRPLNDSYVYNSTGFGVKAYIIDTGIRLSHNQFGSRAVSGYDAVDGGPATDCDGHGTHVAGTVGGSTYGVAKAVTLVAVRVLDCNGEGTVGGVIAGVDWVTSNHSAGQPAVANMSLGGGYSSALDWAVEDSISDGITYVVAAGNDTDDACWYSPAGVPAAITVGATTTADARRSTSNYGTCLDIFAPGSDITSAWYSSNTATNTISGTSMASPHVAGVAALYLQGNPTASPATVRSAIVNNATTGVVSNAGSGSPNRLLYSRVGGSTPPPPPPTGPANDAFGSAQVLTGDWGSASGTNNDATGEPGEPSNTSGSSPINSVWYRWTAPATGEAWIETCGSSFDTTLGVYVGSAVGSLTEIASNDDDPYEYCDVGSGLYLNTTAGVTYRISVDGYGAAQGSISLYYEMTYEEPSTAPANDNLDSAKAIYDSTGSTSGSNVYATGESGEPLNTSASEPVNSVWFSWTAPSSEIVEFETCDSDFDTTLGVYTGSSVDDLTLVAANDDDPTDACGRRSRVSFNSTAGETYYFSIDGYEDKTGYIGLAWAPSTTDVTPPIVDNPTGLITTSQTLGTLLNVRLSWPAASDPSGIVLYELQIKKGTGAFVNVPLPSPTTTEIDRALAPGATYRFRVRATDGAGNVSAWAPSSNAQLKVAQETSTKIAYAGTWSRAKLTGSSGGYVKYASTAGARVLFSFNGTNAVLVTTTGPARGIGDVYIDGAKVGSIDFYSTTVRKKRIAWALGTRLESTNHIFEIRVTGQRNAASTSNRIDVDAFVSWP